MSCTPPKTDAERAALRIRIAKLEATYDQIMSGTNIRKFVDQNGEQVEYGTANSDKLLAYIQSLKACLDPTFRRFYTPRPIGFIFPR